MDFLEIQDHFLIVMLQKYLQLSGLRNWDFLMEVSFLAYQIFLKIAVLLQYTNLGLGQKGISGHKTLILRPLKNRYFSHITIIKWSQISKNLHQKVLL